MSPAISGKRTIRACVKASWSSGVAVQHSTLVFQQYSPVWDRWFRDAVLAGGLSIPDFAENSTRYLAVKWIPPKWDWVDLFKDRKAEAEAIEAGLKSRSVWPITWKILVQYVVLDDPPSNKPEDHRPGIKVRISGLDSRADELSSRRL